MNVALIYIDKLPLDGDNKFILDFSTEDSAQKVNFDKKTDYYVLSLNYNLILKDEIKKDKNKAVHKLSVISRELNKNGPAYQIDFGYLQSGMHAIFGFDEKGKIFNFKFYPDEMKNNLYKHKYYDTTEEKIKACEIFSPFSLFKCNGFTSENKTDFVQMRLFDNYTKTEYIFVHDSEDGSKFANAMFRDRNSIFVKDRNTIKWYGTNADVFLEASNYAIIQKGNFSATEFFWDYYAVKKKRKWLRSRK